ncbi:MAG: hypothetical protein HZB82_06465 [Deltaproteobacteria bacterium]|nr:hypothetical protein [Deltaproteobacteria bacterium]
MKISQTVFKLVGPGAPDEVRMNTAMRLQPPEGVQPPDGSQSPEPEAPPLSPSDEVTALFILTHDKNPGVAAAAKKSLGEYPLSRLHDALDMPIDPLVLAWAVAEFRENDAVLAMAAMNPNIDGNTLLKLAETGPEEVIMILADEKKRILQNPAILEALKKNPLAPANVVDALDAYVKSGGTAQVELLPPPEGVQPLEGAEPPQAVQPPALSEEQARLAETALPEEAAAILDAMKSVVAKTSTGEKPAEAEKTVKKTPDAKKSLNIYKLAAELSFGQKIKLALTGNKSVREYFAKDANKLISTSVLKNPRITENEVMRIAGSKSSPDALLRMIAAKKDWLKNYTLKLSVIQNPKTPIAISTKLMDSLQLKDVEILSKSKGVPQALVSAAKRKLDSKKKSG